MIRKALAAAALAAMAPAAAQAQLRPTVGLVMEAAAEIGGDPIATVGFEDGSEQEVSSGQGGTIAVGAQVRPAPGSPLGLRGTVGFKYVTTKATNADINFTRVPIELIASYRLPADLWVGAGVVRHTAIKFRGGGLGSDVDFEDANGATVEAGWRWVGLSYTSMRYTDEAGAEYDASVFGLVLTSAFGR